MPDTETDDTASGPVTAYKGFNADMTCRGFQYTEGETYEHDGPVRLCESGFHAVLAPIDVLAYYPPNSSVFHVVELDGVTEQSDGDSKVAARKLTVGGSIGIPGLVKAQVEYVTSRATKEKGGHATGYSGAASATGYRGAASATGAESIAIATGYDGRAMGGEGCWIVLTERDTDWRILEVRAVKVGTKPNGSRGITVKPGVFYKLVGGKVVTA